jgi:hypothetical protein
MIFIIGFSVYFPALRGSKFHPTQLLSILTSLYKYFTSPSLESPSWNIKRTLFKFIGQ